MTTSFELILQHTVAPIVLISGVGLVLLSLNNRYSSAMAKTRTLINDLSEKHEESRRINLQTQIMILLKRCSLLRLSIAMVVASTISSSFIVVISILEAIMNSNAEFLLMALLLLSCLCIMIANLLLFWDVAISLQALKLEVNYALRHSDHGKV